MKYELEGTVEYIGEIKEFSSGYTKRDAVIDTNARGKYPCPVKVTFAKENIDRECAKMNVGDKVRVEFFLNGRKWDGQNGTQYFVDLSAVGVTVVEAAKNADRPKCLGDLLKEDEQNVNVIYEKLMEFGQAYGLSRNEVNAKCDEHKKAIGGKKFSRIDFEAVAAGIAGNETQGDGLEDEDDMPF